MQFDPCPPGYGYQFVPTAAYVVAGKLFDRETDEPWVVPDGCSADYDNQCYKVECWNTACLNERLQLSDYVDEWREQEDWTDEAEEAFLAKFHLSQDYPAGRGLDGLGLV